jgi:hypothetical protein
LARRTVPIFNAQLVQGLLIPEEKRNDKRKEDIRKPNDTASYSIRPEYRGKEVIKRGKKWRKIANKKVLRRLAYF